MAPDTKPILKDSTLSFAGGVNDSENPDAIDVDQVQHAVNTTVRGGRAKPRSGLVRRPLTFNVNLSRVFQRGFFQHADFYNGNGYPSLMAVISGRVFKIDCLTWAVTDVTPLVPAYTVLTADFVVPAVGNSLQIQVESTSQIFAEIGNITIAGNNLGTASVDSSTLVTITNSVASQAGVAVNNPVTTAGFTIPALFGTVNVAVNDTTSLNDWVGKSIKIGGNTLYLVSVNSGVQITVQNTLSTAGTVVNSPAYILGQKVSFNTYDANNAADLLGWSISAEKYWIYQNNRAYPIIFNGSASRRADPSTYEVPVGNVMCYTAGRISVALPDRSSYRVGDIYGGSSATGGDPASAIIKFTENNYLNEGGDFVARIFGAPSNSGPIYVMKAGAMTDTQLGQGPMEVGTPNVIFSVNLPYDRTIWKNLANALQTAKPIKGPLSQRSTVLVNADLWYRAQDGIRSYILAQRQFNSFGNTPNSTELGNLLIYDNMPWLENGSGALFDNRLLMTVSPMLTANGVMHRGLVVLDFHLISNTKKKLPPSWEGVWTGQQIFQVVPALIDNKERLFLFVLNANNHIELWEMDPKAKFDDVSTPIVWNMDLRSYTCGDTDLYKSLKAGRMVLQGLTGTLNWTLKYRTDSTACWNAWDSGSNCAKYQDCANPGDCAGPHTYREQVRVPINFREPPDGFDSITKAKLRTGYEFQPRLELSGYAEVKEFRIYAITEPEIFVRERNAP